MFKLKANSKIISAHELSGGNIMFLIILLHQNIRFGIQKVLRQGNDMPTLSH